MLEPLQMPGSPASALESATVDGVWDQGFSEWVLMSVQPPLVDLRVCKQPAKSVSTNVRKFSVAAFLFWNSNLQTIHGFPMR